MKILITGAHGFTARHLISHFSQNHETELILTDKQVQEGKNWHACDLADYRAVCDLVSLTKPQQIYHCAGSFTNKYEDDYKANVLSTINIFDSITNAKIICRILLIGSSAEYGVIRPSDNPVKEDHPLKPVSIYGLTKVFQTHVMNLYSFSRHIDVVMARTFNLMGKGMSNKLFIGRLYEQIDEYKKGNVSRIRMGNLRNKRDYIGIEDAIQYYEMIMQHGKAGEIYNVGSGTSIRMLDVLENILKNNDVPLDIFDQTGSDSQSKIDIDDIYADLTKISELKKTV
jgi:GDP-4-dehydro-6-deoxy-D-mannose reductase